MITKYHHYYIVDVRPWPLIISFNSFSFFSSLVLYLKFSIYTSLYLSIFTCFLGSIFWWMRYSEEFNFDGFGSFNLESGIKISILLFISSEILFFFSFFWSYFHFFLSPTIETRMFWPPFSILSFNYMAVPFLNTLILLSSGVTVTLSHYFLIKGQHNSFIFFLFITIFLGLIFTSFQLIEYYRSFFSIRDGTFGTTFFMLTGFHGIHVFIGARFLIVVFKRNSKIYTTKDEFLIFELASWYWHFVDVVWIFLYFLIYFINS